MAKNRNKPRPSPAKVAAPYPLARLVGAAVIVCAVLISALVFVLNRESPGESAVSSTRDGTAKDASGQSATPRPNTAAELPKIEVNQAVMVTVELNFGATVPTIAEALREIERRHQPDDGNGRVFAVLDAYGEPTSDGKKLHMSMHVSTEKPGIGSLLFKRTGEVLWSNRIVPTTNATTSFSGTALTILLDNGAGKVFTVDGSRGPASILDAFLKEPGLPVADLWPDGAEREVTFIYSACGCPVKVMCRRMGNRTVRTKDLPVIFPDDPAVVTLIGRLMAW